MFDLEITKLSTFILMIVFYLVLWFSDICIRNVIDVSIRRHRRGVYFWILISFRTMFFGAKLIIIILCMKYMYYYCF